ncbi:arginine N-succinyltransferase [Paraburkholderia sp. RP-4-7]|uniref:Arginine N-succinyltransferase n=1 Tax=Paraburkholderia polaris TaxID=2728848 RepID=A0A848IRC7_9BURK|nr:arginine N-succinyltransferase [Paraburkholderia polaris]NMM03663.1 arginine N-succinyltransferase [Paraburkholderia polaris]
MFFVRPANASDFDNIERMVRSDGPPLHSLPPDPERLAKWLQDSSRSISANVSSPGDECYCFVLEDATTGKLHGVASIAATARHRAPFYAFREEALVHASRELNVNHRVSALTISHDLTQHSRLTGCYFGEMVREQPAVAQLLSSARLMFAALYRERFAEEVFTMLPGLVDENGRMPFWDGVGYKFFGCDVGQLEVKSSGRGRTFIPEMLPVDPLYVGLLSDEAQRAIGQIHSSAEAAYRCHLDEGLLNSNFIDIFDAGPVLTAPFKRCHSVREGLMRKAVRGSVGAAEQEYLLSNTSAQGFRCTAIRLPADLPPEVALPGPVADLLGVDEGDSVRFVPVPNGRKA